MQLPGFGGSASLPPPPPPPPTREDPAIAESKRKQRQAELRRKGRAASILTGDEDTLGNPVINRPAAGAARVLGG